MHFLDVLLTLRDQFFDNFLLLSYDRTELRVHDARMQFTVHECGTLVLFYVAGVHRSHYFDVLRESLLFEIAYSEFVSISQEVLDAVTCAVVFQVIHEVCAVAFHLLIAGDRTEDDLSETLRSKCSEAYAANRSALFDERQRFVFAANVCCERKKQMCRQWTGWWLDLSRTNSEFILTYQRLIG